MHLSFFQSPSVYVYIEATGMGFSRWLRCRPCSCSFVNLDPLCFDILTDCMIDLLTDFSFAAPWAIIKVINKVVDVAMP